jgi:vancomycin resistance protein YoaR
MLREFFRPIPFLVATLIALFVAPVAAVAYHQTQHDGRVFTGVRLNGADLSGKTPEEVFAIAQQQSSYYGLPNLKLKAGDQVFDFRPAEFGSTFDPAATVRLAMHIGREGDWTRQLQERAQVYWNGVDIGPTVRMDTGAAARRVAQIAEQLDRPAIDAKLDVDAASGTVRETPAQTGVALDQTTSVRLIEAAILSRVGTEIILPLTSTPPRIASVTNAATTLSRIIGSDLIVMLPQWDKDGQPVAPVEAFRVSRANMSDYALVEEVTQNGQPTLDVRFRRESVRTKIVPLAGAITGTLQNARFVFDDLTGKLSVIQPSRAGRALDVDATLDAIQAAALSDSNRTVVAAVTIVQPPVPDTATGPELGITQLITQATTFFKGSSAARLANVKLAASRFHGVVVPPGEVFSFNSFLGNVSKEEGFEEGLIIVGNRTEKGVGGGVCQVSTTAFQAALRAGFPIVERYPHGYRVSYYERGMGAGYDAAVFTPWADLKFRNDTKSHLLIETYYDPAKVTLTFKFYGTRDGRDVFISPSKISGTVPHGPDLYEPDPENQLAAGQVKQVEYAVDGAVMSFQRIVKRGSETLLDETIGSKYVPWRNVFRFGPGFTPPPGAEIVTP